jgi:hypothetical protein
VERYGMLRVENSIALKMFYYNMFLKENVKKFEEFFSDLLQKVYLFLNQLMLLLKNLTLILLDIRFMPKKKN